MANVFVRAATSTDAASLAELQHDAWLARYALVLPPEVLADEPTSTDAWRSVCESGDARSDTLVLVAVSDDTIVGVLASVPATDPDLADEGWVEIAELAVAADHVGEGHGSRLLAAWADLSRDSGTTTGGVMWIHAADDDLRGLLGAAGFAADGAHRTLDLRGDGTVTVRMIRLAALVGSTDTDTT